MTIILTAVTLAHKQLGMCQVPITQVLSKGMNRWTSLVSPVFLDCDGVTGLHRVDLVQAFQDRRPGATRALTSKVSVPSSVPFHLGQASRSFWTLVSSSITSAQRPLPLAGGENQE